MNSEIIDNESVAYGALIIFFIIFSIRKLIYLVTIQLLKHNSTLPGKLIVKKVG